MPPAAALWRAALWQAALWQAALWQAALGQREATACMGCVWAKPACAPANVNATAPVSSHQFFRCFKAVFLLSFLSDNAYLAAFAAA